MQFGNMCPWASITKRLMAVIKSVMYKASVFVKPSKI